MPSNIKLSKFEQSDGVWFLFSLLIPSTIFKYNEFETKKKLRYNQIDTMTLSHRINQPQH